MSIFLIFWALYSIIRILFDWFFGSISTLFIYKNILLGSFGLNSYSSLRFLGLGSTFCLGCIGLVLI